MTPLGITTEVSSVAPKNALLPMVSKLLEPEKEIVVSVITSWNAAISIEVTLAGMVIEMS